MAHIVYQRGELCDVGDTTANNFNASYTQLVGYTSSGRPVYYVAGQIRRWGEQAHHFTAYMDPNGLYREQQEPSARSVGSENQYWVQYDVNSGRMLLNTDLTTFQTASSFDFNVYADNGRSVSNYADVNYEHSDYMGYFSRSTAQHFEGFQVQSSGFSSTFSPLPCSVSVTTNGTGPAQAKGYVQRGTCSSGSVYDMFTSNRVTNG